MAKGVQSFRMETIRVKVIKVAVRVTRHARKITFKFVEIVSPSSTFLDYVKKLNLYGEYRVREYWIVDPKKKTVFVYELDETGRYGAPSIFSSTDSIKMGIFEDLIIDMKEIFE